MIQIKQGVKFIYSPGGLSILNALKAISKMMSKDLTITSGADGIHFDGEKSFSDSNKPNPADPHYSGNAYDVRSHDFDDTTKQQFLANLNNLLPRDKFYYYLENPKTADEHFHIQTKKGTIFHIEDFLTL